VEGSTIDPGEAVQLSTKKFDDGLAVRREVLGDEYVDRSLNDGDEFSRPLQQLVTEYCWGTIWTRPGLPRKTRSLLNVGIMTALNRPHELELHVRGALRNGCDKTEVVEVLLQTAVYCGMPAALDGLRVARTVFAEFDNAEASGSPA
jgi:4-carboxymuconolactone decarboxylase